MEHPAHTALFQPILNYPAGENAQKRKFGIMSLSINWILIKALNTTDLKGFRWDNLL